MEDHMAVTKKAPAKKTAAKKAVAKKVTKKAAPATKSVTMKKTAPVKKAPAKALSLKDRVASVIENGGRFAAVATVGADKKPHVRIMALKNVGLDIYSASFTKSNKVAQIKDNHFVSITILKDHTTMMSDYIRVEAVATVLTDAKTRKEFWSEGLGYYFKGPDDPNYCVIRFKPTLIEFNDGKTMKTEVLKPGK